MTLEEMREIRKKLGLRYDEIAKRSGVPMPTVQKVLGGVTKSPRYQTILALEKYFEETIRDASGGAYHTGGGSSGQARTDGGSVSQARTGGRSGGQARTGGRSGGGDKGSVVAEEAISYEDTWLRALRAVSAEGMKRQGRDFSAILGKCQGEYTVEDRDRLPEEIRTELIDGVLYDMASPALVHQVISMEMAVQLRQQIDDCGRDCMVFAAPTDVALFGEKDQKTVVQPDVLVVCDPAMLSKKGVDGAPAFVAEILSPSTRSKDILLKNYKYGEAAVQEYWIIDPDKLTISVHDYRKDPSGLEQTDYGFDDVVPVGISGGHCEVDFKLIKKQIDRVNR